MADASKMLKKPAAATANNKKTPGKVVE